MTIKYDEDTDEMTIIFDEYPDATNNFSVNFSVDGDIIGIEISEASKIINQLYKKVN